MWMNEYEVNDAVAYFNPAESPNLARAAQVLQSLMEWTNTHSDGWPYWQKPSRAARRLMDLIYPNLHWHNHGGADGDISEADLRGALSPIKAFLTLQGVPHSEVFDV